MTRSRRLSIRAQWEPVLTVTRSAVAASKLVYVIRLDRPVSYMKGRSRIAYIGMSEAGFERVAQSSARRAPDVYGTFRGVRRFDAHIVTSKARQNVRTARVLERALLGAFLDRFGQLPGLNKNGPGRKLESAWQTFSKQRARRMIEEFS